MHLSHSNCYGVRELFFLPPHISGQLSIDSWGKYLRAAKGASQRLFCPLRWPDHQVFVKELLGVLGNMLTELDENVYPTCMRVCKNCSSAFTLQLLFRLNK